MFDIKLNITDYINLLLWQIAVTFPKIMSAEKKI